MSACVMGEVRAQVIDESLTGGDELGLRGAGKWTGLDDGMRCWRPLLSCRDAVARLSGEARRVSGRWHGRWHGIAITAIADQVSVVVDIESHHSLSHCPCWRYLHCCANSNLQNR